MAGNIHLRPINDIIAEVNASCAHSIALAIQNLEQQRVETIALIEQNRLVLPEIQEVWPDLDLRQWERGDYIQISLGEQPAGKKARAAFNARLVALRTILGSLKVSGKDVCDGRRKLLEVCLTPPAYPGIRIRYRTKLPKGAKCRIERTRHRAYISHNLVCDITQRSY